MPKRSEVDAWLAAGARPCDRCHKTKPFSEFPVHKATRSGVWNLCIPCKREQGIEYHQDNRDKVLAQNRQRRFDALKVLGGKCAECGIDDLRLLEFDHIEPLNSAKGRTINKWLKEIIAGNTENIQALCANCHVLKTYWT